MKIKTLSLLLVILIFGSQLKAQDDFSTKRAEIQKQKIEFIKTKLQLTEDEQSAFFPVFNEFEEKKHEIIKRKHQIFRNFEKNSMNLSHDEITKMTNEITELNISESKLFAEYNTKFNQVLPPMKVMLLYINEHEFKKELIRKMNQK